MKDAPTKISIIKVDENNTPLKNADLQILDSNGETIVGTWTTDGNPYEVTGKLTVGKTYTLHEVKAPDGYLSADDVAFTVKDTSDVQSVKMIDKQTVTRFNKIDENGNPVRGATLQLLNASGTKVHEWITDGTAKEIKGLTAGANYILRESKNISYHANLMNVSVTEYISLCIRRKRIVICEDFPDLIYHLSKIGTNINQIATIANTNQYISITNVEEVKQLMQKCYTELNNFIAFVAEPEKDYLQNDTEKISELLSQLTDSVKSINVRLIKIEEHLKI